MVTEIKAQIARPERLVPHHLSRETGKRGELADQIGQGLEAGLPQAQLDPLRTEYRRTREMEIAQAPDLDGALRRKAQEEGLEDKLEENTNYALREIQWFQNAVRTAQDLRRVIKASDDPGEMTRAAIEYSRIKRMIDEDIDAYGPSFERAYRDYIRGRVRFIRFRGVQSRIRRLENALGEPAFEGYPDDGEPNVRARSRLEALSRAQSQTEEPEADELLDSLKSIYPEESLEYKRLQEEIDRSMSSDGDSNRVLSKAEMRDEITSLQSQAENLWNDGMVQYFWKMGKWDELLRAFAEGADVLETQSTIRNLNLLHEWEQQHQRTTIGSVLVGPPGVGKTTLVRHYLELKKRGYVYIDLSEDVTRYLLYGSKAIDFRSATEQYEGLAKRIGNMDEDQFRKFIDENSVLVGGAMNLPPDEAKLVTISMLEQEFDKEAGENGNGGNVHSEAKQRVTDLAERAYRKELATEFAHLLSKNGWRDGVIVAALRRGDSIIMDEFNKNANWSLIYGLMTVKPGERWYFADNDEYINVPKTWRMYFTANIGRRHKTFAVAEALASRAEGKVMELDYPPSKEEMDVGLAAFSDAEGNFLRPTDDFAKLYYTINDLFPKVRSYIKDKPASIPISFRTIRDIGEKLVLYTDPKSGKPVYRATDKTYDEALYEVLIDSYRLYEDQTVPQEIVRLGINIGLFLDPSIEDKVLKWVSKEDYEEAKTAFAEKKEDYYDIVKKMRGVPDAPETAQIVAGQTLNF